MFWRIHHSVGDGLGLMFAFAPLLGCECGDFMSKVPLPSALLPPGVRKYDSAGELAPARANKCCQACSPMSFLRGAAVSLLTKHDSELKINAPLAKRTPFLRFNGQRVYRRFPPVPMVLYLKPRHGTNAL